MTPEEKIWAIVKLNFKREDPSIITGGLCGSGFFVSPRKFVTAKHFFNPDLFVPLKGCICKIFLTSQQGDQIEINSFSEFSQSIEDDVVFKICDGDYPYLEKETFFNKDEVVYNLGYPECLSSTLLEILNLNPLKILLKKPIKQEGKIMGLTNMNLDRDVKLRNIDCVLLNYNSIKGFSGGPLLSKEGKVIGMMSFSANVAGAVTNQHF